MDRTDHRTLKAKKALGSRLKKLRENADFSGREAAEQIALDQSSISRVENGRLGISAETLTRMLVAYGVPLAEQEEVHRLWDQAHLPSQTLRRQEEMTANPSPTLADALAAAEELPLYIRSALETDDPEQKVPRLNRIDALLLQIHAAVLHARPGSTSVTHPPTER